MTYYVYNGPPSQSSSRILREEHGSSVAVFGGVAQETMRMPGLVRYVVGDDGSIARCERGRTEFLFGGW